MGTALQCHASRAILFFLFESLHPPLEAKKSVFLRNQALSCHLTILDLGIAVLSVAR